MKDTFVKNANWYTKLCRDASLIINGPSKGTMILQPFAVRIWRLVQQKINCQLRKLDFQEVIMPSFVPLQLMNNELTHAGGFAAEFFLVSSNTGVVRQNTRLALRPTSETLFCYYFSKILQRYTQLPLLFYQWGNVFRCEKNTKPFLRNCEFWWHEGHSLHEHTSEARALVLKMHNFYREFVEHVCLLNHDSGRKTELEKFAGAQETFTVETFLPDGQALQCATSHILGQTFTRAFKIKYQASNNIYNYPFQTSFGISSRIIGAMIIAHSDKHGLLLPCALNPQQVVIINRYPLDKSGLRQYSLIAKQLVKTLSVTALIYTTNSFKTRMAELILQGAAIIIQVKITKNNSSSYTFYKRITNDCVQTPTNGMTAFVANLLEKHDQILKQRTTVQLGNQKCWIANYDELKTAIKQKKIAYAFFMPNKIHEAAIKTVTNASIRFIIKGDKTGNCFYSKKTTNYVVCFSRSY